MIFTKAGEVRDGFYVTGSSVVPCYYLEAKRPALFDAGFSCLGPDYERHLRQLLGAERQPAYLFLTHVHFDHCGAAAHLKRIFPEMKIAASPRAAKILAKPRAVKLIYELNQAAVKEMAGWHRPPENPMRFKAFDLDLEVDEGDRLDLGGGLSVQVLATPGHTRDFLSYYIPEKKILIASEAVGCLEYPNYVVSEFLTSYQDYVTAIQRMAKLDVNILCQGHHKVFLEDDARAFFEMSLTAARIFKDRVLSWLAQEKGDVDKVTLCVKAFEWDHRSGPKQPEPAYLLNTRARVQHLKDKFYVNKD